MQLQERAAELRRATAAAEAAESRTTSANDSLSDLCGAVTATYEAAHCDKNEVTTSEKSVSVRRSLLWLQKPGISSFSMHGAATACWFATVRASVHGRQLHFRA